MVPSPFLKVDQLSSTDCGCFPRLFETLKKHLSVRDFKRVQVPGVTRILVYFDDYFPRGQGGNRDILPSR